MWAMQYYLVKEPHHFISSAGLGTMGFGLPAAIGAQFGNPGPGSLVHHRRRQHSDEQPGTGDRGDPSSCPLRIALLNNGTLGMVRQWQKMFFGKRYSQIGLDVGTPDFVKLAEAYGAVGMRVIDQADVRAAIAAGAPITDRPVLIDFRLRAGRERPAR